MSEKGHCHGEEQGEGKGVEVVSELKEEDERGDGGLCPGCEDGS